MIVRGFVLLAATACLAMPAQAGLYRCGKVFQDRPCDGSVPAAPAAKPAQAAAPVAASTAPATRGNRCEGLRRIHQSIESRMRAGGSAEAMESMQQQRRDIQSELTSAGC